MSASIRDAIHSRRFVGSAIPMIAAVAIAAGSASPAAAVSPPTGASINVTASTDGAMAALSAYRDRWGARYTVTVTDTKDEGDCVYAVVILVVANGDDPSYRMDNCQGAGLSVTRGWARLHGPTRGSTIDGIRLKACRNRKWDSDVCGDTTVALPQLRTLASTSRLNQMRAIEALPLADFMTLFNKLKGTTSSGYTWATNGCSVPSGFGAVTDTWKNRFYAACVRHDWGYRNYGSPRFYQAANSRLNWLNNRFMEDLTAICAGQASWHGTACRTVAKVFHQAVVYYGGHRFFEP